jgi:hypothetical protein
MSCRRAVLRAHVASWSVAACIVAVGLIALGGETEPASATPNAPVSSFATSFVLDGSTYAAIPMGDLGDPLNTFWQLFTLPSGATHWALDTPPGVADNGGLVIERGMPSSLEVAFRPSSYLRFTPIAARGAHSGSGWASGGLIPAGLVAAPDAFVGTDGAEFAAVESRGGSVLRAATDSSRWTTIGTASSMSAAARGQCRVEGVESLAAASSLSLYAGTACSSGKRAGILDFANRTWHDIGPTLGSRTRGVTSSVLGLEVSSGALTAVVSTTSDSRTRLILTGSSDGGRTWSTSEPFGLPASASIVSVGSVGSSGAFVVWRSATGVSAAVATRGRWTALPPMPDRAWTLAFPEGTTQAIDAVGGHHSTFLAWHFDTRARRWDETQSMSVPIIYGSSG